MMRASVLHAPYDLRIEQRDVPQPGPTDVRVRVVAVGVCGSDVHYFEHGRIGSVAVRAPMILGHESSGVVDAVGAAVTDRHVGQRVSIEPGVPCRSCEQCLSGRYNLCPSMRFFATPPIDGALAEFVVIPSEFAHPVPAELSDAAAALLEPLSVAVWACRRTTVRPGSRVLVTGAGPIGLLVGLVARASGASSVTVTDVSKQRLAFSEKFGLQALDVADVPIADAGLEPDVLIECSGNPGATVDAISVLAPAGRALLVGAGPEEITLPLSIIQGRELQISGAYRYAQTWPAAIALAAGGVIDLDAIVTGHYGLAEADAALQAARRDPHTFKVIVWPGR